MPASQIDRLRAIVSELLAARGDTAAFSETESLFLGGRLDSMAATHLIIALETEFNLEIGGPDFDVSALDSIAEMTDLLA